MTTYFCDGLKDVTILNGVARLEFQRLETIERGANRELRQVTELVIALPVQGLIAAANALDTVRERLISQNAVSEIAPTLPEKSPNFT